MPGETVRTLVTLWLLFHLFCVALALSNNPNFERQSRLISAIKATPGVDQYMHGLWLDVPYCYRYTWGQQPQDADHALEVEALDADGKSIDTRQFPVPGAHGEVAERYQALARAMAIPLYNEGNNGVFAEKIGGAILEQTGAKEVKFRIRRHRPLSMDDAKGADPAMRDPENAPPKPICTKRRSRSTAAANRQVQQKLSTLDTAPVTNPTKTNSGPPQPGAVAETRATRPTKSNRLAVR